MLSPVSPTQLQAFPLHKILTEFYHSNKITVKCLLQPELFASHPERASGLSKRAQDTVRKQRTNDGRCDGCCEGNAQGSLRRWHFRSDLQEGKPALWRSGENMVWAKGRVGISALSSSCLRLKRRQSCSRKEKGVGSSWRGLKAEVRRVLHGGEVRNLDVITSELGSHWRV